MSCLTKMARATSPFASEYAYEWPTQWASPGLAAALCWAERAVRHSTAAARVGLCNRVLWQVPPTRFGAGPSTHLPRPVPPPPPPPPPRLPPLPNARRAGLCTGDGRISENDLSKLLLMTHKLSGEDRSASDDLVGAHLHKMLDAAQVILHTHICMRSRAPTGRTRPMHVGQWCAGEI